MKAEVDSTRRIFIFFGKWWEGIEEKRHYTPNTDARHNQRPAVEGGAVGDVRAPKDKHSRKETATTKDCER